MKIRNGLRAPDTAQSGRHDARFASIDLDKEYVADLVDGRLERYASRLARDGLTWWCEFETGKLARHLAVLRELGIVLPLRLGFLDEILDLSLSQAGYVAWFERFQSENDGDAAAVTVAAALADIWLSGDDFRRQTAWVERGRRLLETSVAALPRASVLAYSGVMQLLGEAGITQARETFAACREAADAAQSLPLRLFLATFETFALLWSGEFSTAEVMLSEMSAQACQPDTPFMAGVFFRSSLCYFITLRGDAGAARHVLRDDMRRMEFGRLQAIPRLMVLSSQIQAVAMEGDEVATDGLDARLRKRLVPPGKHFYHAMLHVALGVAHLLLGRPSVALAHARAARSLGESSHSRVARDLPVLLEVQARVDMGDNEGALALADAWMSKWQAAGLASIASGAAVEMAVAHVRLGQPDRARATLEHARRLLPRGETLVLFHRPAEYPRRFLELLAPAGKPPRVSCERYPVAIHAFGGLRVRVGARLLYERDWHGVRAKSLLKALLVLGGVKVSADAIAKMLWPDADGDQARNNLKVALWRLRHLGLHEGEAALPWLLLHNGQISLASGVVGVDVITFRENAETALRGPLPDTTALTRALDLYEGDFLAGDNSELWIIDQRARLRDLFLAAARALADQAATREALERALTYLERGHALDPLDERTAERLMRGYLTLGYPGRVLTFFRETEAALGRELGIRPGSALLNLVEQARMAPVG